MNIRKFPSGIVMLFAGAALLVALGMAASFRTFNRMEEAAESRKQTFIVVKNAGDLLAALIDAETGKRGYLLTGDEAFLEPYLAVRDGIPGRLEGLRRLTLTRAAHKRLDALVPLIEGKLTDLSGTIALRRSHGMRAALAKFHASEGKPAMDSIRAELGAFIRVENDALAQYDGAFQSNVRLLFAIIVSITVLILLLALSFAWMVYRETRQRVRNLVHLETEHLLKAQEETNRQLQQANLTLQDREEKLAVTLDSIGDAVIATDASGNVTLLNPLAERLTGWTQAEAAGHPIDGIFHIVNQETRRPATIPVAETLALGTIQGLANHTVLIARDGSERAIADSCAPIRDRDGRVAGAILVFRDVTDDYASQQALRDATEAAEKANLAKSEFLSSMSHELRSPLNAILGFAQLMESDSPPPTPTQKERIGQILQAGWHLLTLINDVLDLAKVESRQIPLSKEPVSLAEVMTECEGMVMPQARQRGIRIAYPRFDLPAFVMADRTRLKQVIINLLSNAIKYNIEQGSVEVKCTAASPGRIRVSVSDTGAGLSPEKVGQLFKAFNRLGQEAGGEEGTGIGLVVAKRLVELMGGAIGVESTVGVGSVFWFELAGVAEPLLSKGAGDEVAFARSNVIRREGLYTVLYVEDNPSNLRLVEQILSHHPDIRLLTAASGRSGIENARTFLPDVILMDINLPDINGFETMQTLRSDPATAHIPVIAVSANAMPIDVGRGLQAGFFRYLTKPINVNELMAALDAALSFSEEEPR